MIRSNSGVNLGISGKQVYDIRACPHPPSIVGGNIAGNELLDDRQCLHTKSIAIVRGVDLLNALIEISRILARRSFHKP
jgi:hypothetical protein